MDWRTGLIIEILHCLDGQRNVNLSREELLEILHDVATSQ